MTRIDPSHLAPYCNPDDLLSTLHEIDEFVPELREPIANLLEHDDPDVRAEAVRILIRRWKDIHARPTACKLLEGDPDEEVREAAAYAIAATSNAESRETDTLALLSRVKDPAESPRVRAAAYDGLLIIYRRPNFPTKRRAFNPDTDIDWEWVNTLANR